MSLFQPTNIYPNILNGDAEGTVDANDDLTITWQINGTSQMTGYSLQITKRGDNAVVYSTDGYTTSGCPVYGRDNLGNVLPFSVTIPVSELSNYANGSNYEINLIMTWGEIEEGGEEPDEEAYVIVPSVVFQARTTPHFSTTTGYVTTINSREWHFDFLNFSTVNIRYFRWVLSLNAGTTAEPVAGQTIYDTGKIYQSGDLSLDYEGFINGQNYVVQCTCCDRYGREVTSDLYPFSCVYDQVNLEFPITVSALTTGSAIHVEWEGANYMYGEAHGNYSIDNDLLTLPTTDDYIIWNNLDFTNDWVIAYRGTLIHSNAVLWSASIGTGALSLEYTVADRTLHLMQDGAEVTLQISLSTLIPVDYGAKISCIIAYGSSYSTIWIRLDEPYGGLYPSETLQPDTTIYPSDSSGTRTRFFTTRSTNINTGTITSLSVHGAQICDFLQEFDTTATYNGVSMLAYVLPRLYHGTSYVPVYGNGTNFSASFQNGLNAGSLYYGDSQFAGWAIYRQQAGTGITREIAELPIEAYSFNDYTARTDGTQYIYDIAPIFVADNNYTNGVAMTSGDPFGILNSNYTILETVFNSDMKCYQLLAEYHFGKNVKTGDVSNNNSPNILENFTRYPTVQLSGQNYMSGSVTSLLGTIKVDENGQVTYSDTRTMRDAIFELSTTSNTLFLKTRKGDLFEIRIANPISISVMEESPTYAQTASINWVQVDDSVDDYVLSYES